MKSSTDLKQARYPSPKRDAARSGLSDSAKDLEERALARSIATDDPKDLPLPDVETHIFQRPEFLDLIALDDLTAVDEICSLTGGIPKLARDNVAKGAVVAHAFGGAV